MSAETIQVPTQEQARTAAAEFREARAANNKIDAKTTESIASINAKQAELKAPHLETEKRALATLQAYSDANRNELCPEGKKSFDFFGLKVSYKLKPAKLTLARAKGKWDEVLAKLKGGVGNEAYITKKEEVNKTALKKADPDLLKEVGVKLLREETFNVEL